MTGSTESCTTFQRSSSLENCCPITLINLGVFRGDPSGTEKVWT